jgi:aminoglycoside phosphotransferase (APT) family kinase protein
MMASPEYPSRRLDVQGMPPVDELLHVYEDARGASAHDLHWFQALVRFKQGAAGAIIAKNARRRGAGPEPADHPVANPLLDSALELLG